MKTTNIYNLHNTMLAVTFVSALTACGGEFSYKQGATAQDLQNQKSDCEEGGRSAEEMNKCLKDNGWIVVDMDSDYSLKPRKLKPVTATYSEPTNNPLAEQPVAESHAAAEPIIPNDPFEIIKVNSWWKTGAGPEQLYLDGDACLESLGEGYEANANFSKLSLGVAYCMEDKNWRVLLDN